MYRLSSLPLAAERIMRIADAWAPRFPITFPRSSLATFSSRMCAWAPTVSLISTASGRSTIAFTIISRSSFIRSPGRYKPEDNGLATVRFPQPDPRFPSRRVVEMVHIQATDPSWNSLPGARCLPGAPPQLWPVYARVTG